ncbi:MAG: hypothetical protein NVS9B4_05390 [Candidatus Acidiferrum sp.]
MFSRGSGEEGERVATERAEHAVQQAALRAGRNLDWRLAAHVGMLSPRREGVNARFGLLKGANSTNDKYSTAKIERGERKARRRETCGQSGWKNRNKGAAKMHSALQPAILNFKSEEDAAGPKHASNFAEGAVLPFEGSQVVQNQQGYG